MHLVRPLRKEMLVTLPIFVRGEPLARPRLSRVHKKAVYQPTENQLKVLAELQVTAPALELNQPLIVDTYFYYTRPKSNKLLYPINGRRPGDIDNLNKGLYDNLVKAKIITDDSLIVGGETYKLWSTDDHILCIIWSIAS